MEGHITVGQVRVGVVVVGEGDSAEVDRDPRACRVVWHAVVCAPADRQIDRQTGRQTDRSRLSH